MSKNNLYLDYTRLRNDLEFSTVLNHYGIEHDSSRKQIKIKCPFHDDRSPSLSISLEDNKWQCFGCHMKGNALEFIAYMEQLDPDVNKDIKIAAHFALDIMGFSADDYRKGAKTASNGRRAKKGSEARPNPSKAKKSDSGASQEADFDQPSNSESEPKHNPVKPELKLSLDPEHPYLAERGITPEIADAYGIGYVKSERGIMKKRIAFPIHNEEGGMLAFVGRWVRAESEMPKHEDKYKFPTGFYKSIVLYNLHRNRGAKHLVLVEGFWSTIKLSELGIPTVSCFGSSFSEEQAQLIADNGTRYVTILFDGDEAGRSGAESALAILGKHVYVRAIELPDGIKPDTMDQEYLDRLR